MRPVGSGAAAAAELVNGGGAPADEEEDAPVAWGVGAGVRKGLCDVAIVDEEMVTVVGEERVTRVSAYVMS